MGKQPQIGGSKRKKDGNDKASKMGTKKRKGHDDDDDLPTLKDHNHNDGTDNSAAVTSSTDAPIETWSKSKKKRMRMMLSKQKKNESDIPLKPNEPKIESVPEQITQDGEGQPRKASKLQSAFEARLSGSRFRILNEELYTKTSEESFERFSKNPELFVQYHEGFRHQVESWPMNPVDVIVRWLADKYKDNGNIINNNNNKTECVVADFGCGDAQLAKDLLNVKKRQDGTSRFKVHSFDLVAPNDLVTACDMANVPLKDKSVDVCVFCLSLMGTNLADFIREAHRVLKEDGKVKIAEVRSRIEYSHSNNKTSSKGREKTDTSKTAGTLTEFLDVLKALGFHCTKKDLSNKMFLLLELEKTGKAPDKKLAFSAKPCIYKRR